jgi:hypothetical protein
MTYMLLDLSAYDDGTSFGVPAALIEDPTLCRNTLADQLGTAQRAVDLVKERAHDAPPPPPPPNPPPPPPPPGGPPHAALTARPSAHATAGSGRPTSRASRSPRSSWTTPWTRPSSAAVSPRCWSSTETIWA